MHMPLSDPPVNDEQPEIADYLAYHGGPFYELQRRLGLIREHMLHVGRRALVFVALAWGVPLILALIEGHAIGPPAQRPFLLDPATWARFFFAIGLFVLSERQIERQLSATLANMIRAPVLAPSSFGAAAEAVLATLRRRDLRRAEAICLILAYAASFVSLVNFDAASAPSWAAWRSESGAGHTIAAWWCLLVSGPIFWFLLLRCLWREFVWARLLRSLAKLELRLVASHPDGKAGLAFIGYYPNAYAMFVLGASAVVGAAVSRQLITDHVTVTVYGYAMAAWLALVLALFAFPLLAFTPPLVALKTRTMLLAGAQATRYHRMAERKLLGENAVAADKSEAESQTDVADASKHYDSAKKLTVILLNRPALIPVAAAALLPLFLAGITELPYKELWSIIKRLLVL